MLHRIREIYDKQNVFDYVVIVIVILDINAMNVASKRWLLYNELSPIWQLGIGHVELRRLVTKITLINVWF